MPHIEIHYSDNIRLPIQALFADVEKVINAIDDSAGACKSRAYPATEFLHTHVLVKVSLLQKPHRDEVFTQKMVSALSKCVQAHLIEACYFSLDIQYAPNHYLTTSFSPQ